MTMFLHETGGDGESFRRLQVGDLGNEEGKELTTTRRQQNTSRVNRAGKWFQYRFSIFSSFAQFFRGVFAKYYFYSSFKYSLKISKIQEKKFFPLLFEIQIQNKNLHEFS